MCIFYILGYTVSVCFLAGCSGCCMYVLHPPVQTLPHHGHGEPSLPARRLYQRDHHQLHRHLWGAAGAAFVQCRQTGSPREPQQDHRKLPSYLIGIKYRHLSFLSVDGVMWSKTFYQLTAWNQGSWKQKKNVPWSFAEVWKKYPDWKFLAVEYNFFQNNKINL